MCLISISFCGVVFVIREGKGKMLYFVVVVVEVLIIIFHVIYLSSFLFLPESAIVLRRR